MFIYQSSTTPTRWVDWKGNSVQISPGEAVEIYPSQDIEDIIHGVKLGNPVDLIFRDPACFRAGELHNHYERWQQIAGDNPSDHEMQVLMQVHNQISIFEFFQPYRESFKGKRPPPNNSKTIFLVNL